MLRPTLRFVSILTMATSALLAQSFEVASVKRYAAHSGANGTFAPNVIDLYRPFVLARVEYFHVSLKDILMAAYGVGKDQIAGPVWMNSEHYDIVAKLPSGALANQVPAMLQDLLAERFRVTVHRETVSRKGFALLADKTGAELTATKVGSKSNIEQGVGYFRFTNYTVGDFARLVSIFMSRPIADQTRIQGRYDITLKVYGGDLKLAGSDGDRAMKSVVDALRDLGLRLESGIVPATNIVVDKADRIPTAD